MGAHAVRLSNVDIDNALKNRDFEVLFQPIFDLGNGAFARVETFVRWRHASLGVLPPGAFISFLESQGRMGELTRYVMAQSLDAYMNWRGPYPPGFSINLALSDLTDPNFAPEFEGLLSKHDFPPEYVTLECPMPPVTADAAEIAASLDRLADTGARLAIEVRGRANDFLRTIAPFPFAEIKTGGAAILRFARTVRGPGLSAISELLELAAASNAAITAVGVEDEASLKALKGLGFAAAQGNLLGKVGALSQFTSGRVNDVRSLLGLAPLSREDLAALFRTGAPTTRPDEAGETAKTRAGSTDRAPDDAAPLPDQSAFEKAAPDHAANDAGDAAEAAREAPAAGAPPTDDRTTDAGVMDGPGRSENDAPPAHTDVGARARRAARSSAQRRGVRRPAASDEELLERLSARLSAQGRRDAKNAHSAAGDASSKGSEGRAAGAVDGAPAPRIRRRAAERSLAKSPDAGAPRALQDRLQQEFEAFAGDDAEQTPPESPADAAATPTQTSDGDPAERTARDDDRDDNQPLETPRSAIDETSADHGGQAITADQTVEAPLQPTKTDPQPAAKPMETAANMRKIDSGAPSDQIAREDEDFDEIADEGAGGEADSLADAAGLSAALLDGLAGAPRPTDKKFIETTPAEAGDDEHVEAVESATQEALEEAADAIADLDDADTTPAGDSADPVSAAGEPDVENYADTDSAAPIAAEVTGEKAVEMGADVSDAVDDTDPTTDEVSDTVEGDGPAAPTVGEDSVADAADEEEGAVVPQDGASAEAEDTEETDEVDEPHRVDPVADTSPTGIDDAPVGDDDDEIEFELVDESDPDDDEGAPDTPQPSDDSAAETAPIHHGGLDPFQGDISFAPTSERSFVSASMAIRNAPGQFLSYIRVANPDYDPGARILASVAQRASASAAQEASPTPPDEDATPPDDAVSPNEDVVSVEHVGVVEDAAADDERTRDAADQDEAPISESTSTETPLNEPTLNEPSQNGATADENAIGDMLDDDLAREDEAALAERLRRPARRSQNFLTRKYPIYLSGYFWPRAWRRAWARRRREREAEAA